MPKPAACLSHYKIASYYTENECTKIVAFETEEVIDTTYGQMVRTTPPRLPLVATTENRGSSI